MKGSFKFKIFFCLFIFLGFHSLYSMDAFRKKITKVFFDDRDAVPATVFRDNIREARRLNMRSPSLFESFIENEIKPSIVFIDQIKDEGRKLNAILNLIKPPFKSKADGLSRQIAGIVRGANTFTKTKSWTSEKEFR